MTSRAKFTEADVEFWTAYREYSMLNSIIDDVEGDVGRRLYARSNKLSGIIVDLITAKEKQQMMQAMIQVVPHL